MNEDAKRLVLIAELKTWDTICKDKHGFAMPLSEDDLAKLPLSDLELELKKLKTLGRTPHE